MTLIKKKIDLQSPAGDIKRQGVEPFAQVDHSDSGLSDAERFAFGGATAR